MVKTRKKPAERSQEDRWAPDFTRERPQGRAVPSREQLLQAMAAGRLEPKAVAARYQPRKRRIIVTLDSGAEFVFPPALAEGLTGARPKDLAAVEVSPAGLGLYWPTLDVDLSVAGLLAGVFGSPSWMAMLSRTSPRRPGPQAPPPKAMTGKRLSLSRLQAMADAPPSPSARVFSNEEINQWLASDQFPPKKRKPPQRKTR